MLGYEIYIYGELTDYRINEKFKMNFNPDNGKYELNTFLKQGLYDYQYVVMSIYSEFPDEGLIEGSHYDTENNYTILVYYSNPIEGYDQLIGLDRINSRVSVDHIYND